MKKIFSKLENKNEEKLPSGNFTNFTGKQFQINKHTVVVEEILAEGVYLLKNKKLDICSKFFFFIFFNSYERTNVISIEQFAAPLMFLIIKFFYFIYRRFCNSVFSEGQ